MNSWMKINFIVVISVVMNTSSWAKPALPKAMHALDDSELSKITDHDHSDKNSLSHTHGLPVEKKEVSQSLFKEDDLQKMKIIRIP